MEKLTKALMTDETGQAIVTKLTALSGQVHELAMATRGSAILFESESDISVLGDGGYLAVYVGTTNPLVISGWTGDNSLVTKHLYYLIKSGTNVASSDLGEYGGTAVTDTTLSVSGAPADAKTVGEALALKADSFDVDALDTRVTAVEDDILELQDGGYVADQQKITEKINDWLGEHPEATTTVQDGSLTEAKFSNALKTKAIKDHVTPEMYGAVGDGQTDDTQALQDAVDAGFSNNKAVLLSGSYLITDSIKVKGISATYNAKGSVIIGNGNAHIIAGTALTNIIETFPTADSKAYGIVIKDLYLDGNNQVTNGLYSGYATAGCVFENVTIKQCTNGLHISGNCYLNTFTNIRTYHCTDYGIWFENGNNTSNVFTKCYVDTSVNAYKINGQYTTMISCCADAISGVVFDLASFNGTLVGCGSEAKTFQCMFKVAQSTLLNIVGGMFWANPTLPTTAYYFDVAGGCEVNVYGARLNYMTGTSSTGALCHLGASAKLMIRDSYIIKPFDTDNTITTSSVLLVNTAVYTAELSVTVDSTTCEVDLPLSPTKYAVLDVYVRGGRTGWIPVVYRRTIDKLTLKMMGNSSYIPTTSNYDFDITVTYIDKKAI